MSSASAWRNSLVIDCDWQVNAQHQAQAAATQSHQYDAQAQQLQAEAQTPSYVTVAPQLLPPAQPSVALACFSNLPCWVLHILLQ